MAAGGAGALARDLRALVRGRVEAEGPALDEAAADFGGLARRRPACVVAPALVDDVVAAVRYANRVGARVVARGAGHCQHGQGLGEGAVVLAMRSLARVGPPDPAARAVEAEAGASWYAVAEAAAAAGMLPSVLTNHLGVTVGGTLGVGGVGSTSWRYGAQIENVLALDVVTGDGELRRCDPRRDPELFDAARGGLGQCGVVVRATLGLRAFAPRLRTYRFRCEGGPDALVAGLAALAREGRAQHLECENLASLGAPRAEGEPAAFELAAGVEFEGDAPPEPPGRGDPSLRPIGASDALVWAGRRPQHRFFDPAGAPHGAGLVRPWVDAIVTARGAARALAAALDPANEPLPDFLNLLWPLGQGRAPAPLFAVPEGPRPLFVYSLLPQLPDADPEVVAELLAIMDEVSDDLVGAGGKRYLSGYLPRRDAAAWAAHFGERWGWFAAMKAKYDPNRALDNGLIAWPS